jgi:NADH dehydrogenase FAD-containing subunit
MSRLDKDSHYQDLKQQPVKHILILGSGFAGIEVVKRVQKKFKNNKNVEINNKKI